MTTAAAPDDGHASGGHTGDSAPGDGTPGDGTPGDGTPGDGTPGDGKAGPTAGSPPRRSVPPWALPGELATFEGWPPGRRTVRDWVADATLFLIAVAVWAALWHDLRTDPDPSYLELIPDWMQAIDPWVGAVACLALWARRRFPTTLAIVMVGLLFVSGTAYGAVLISILTVAIHRGWVPAAAVTAANIGQSVLFAFTWQPENMSVRAYVATVILTYLAPLSWGLVVRFRRQVVAGLRREAERQQREQEHGLAQARRAERQRIAWEMHDVLAHRISLLSVHAGALSYRTSTADDGVVPPSTEEIHEAVEVIRENAHQALDELGEVLSVLRADDDDPEARGSLPLIRDLPRLVDEARAAGQPVRFLLDLGPPDGRPPRPQVQRTAYRIVQEALTNVRKHAPDAPVEVRVHGSPDAGLTVELTNPLPIGVTEAQIPGAGAGLTGLAERVALDGGTLQHGVVEGRFQIAAQLPWRTDR